MKSPAHIDAERPWGQKLMRPERRRGVPGGAFDREGESNHQTAIIRIDAGPRLWTSDMMFLLCNGLAAGIEPGKSVRRTGPLSQGELST